MAGLATGRRRGTRTRTHQTYLAKPGIIGIYVVGSATRPYRDGLSDYDIEVIVEDGVYDSTPMSERQVFFFKDGESKVVDYEFYLIPWSDFVNLTKSIIVFCTETGAPLLM